MSPDNVNPDNAGDSWSALDRHTVTVTGIMMLGAAVLAGVPTTIGLAGWQSVGFALAWVLPGATLLIVGGILADYVRWRRTRYRISPETVELHKGIVFLSRRRLARNRIRAVDTSAHPLLRVFGLVTLTIGTGEQGGGGSASDTIVLDPVSRRTGELLQAALLDRGRAPAYTGAGRLATWRPVWVRYAPLSIATVIFTGAIVGAAFQVSDWFGRGSLPVELVGGLIARYGPWWVIGLGVPAVVILAAGIATTFHLEAWWGYQLDREPDGTLRVRRGLLTRRSLSLEEDRVRGVDVIEPLGVRVAGAARVQAIATGLSVAAEQKSEISTLLPAAPRTVALAVAEQVCGEAPTVALIGHPIAARSRRLRWAMIIILAVITVWVLAAGLTGWFAWWSVASAVLVVVTAVALVARALDSYRNLGHALTEQHLVTRRGSIRRSTALLRRNGIIGWHVRQSIFQRRAGLATLVATTAAGRGHYALADGGDGELLELAAQAVPGLMEPFLQRD